MRRGLVIGCGGTLGAAWTVGALVAVSEALDWDPRSAEMLVGTSAGAEFAALLGSGVGVPELLAGQLGDPSSRARHFASPPGMLPPPPRLRLGSARLAARALRGEVAPMTALSGLLPEGSGTPRHLEALASVLTPEGGWVQHPSAWLVAVDYDTGERTAFGAPGTPSVPLRDALRASWAVPGWYPPVRVGERRFIDGGVVSPTSADLVLPAALDEVVVLAPMASAHPGRPTSAGAAAERLLRTPMTRRLDSEVNALRMAGVRVIRLDPSSADLAAAGGNFMDHRKRLRVLETSLRTSRSAVHRALVSNRSPNTTTEHARRGA